MVNYLGEVRCITYVSAGDKENKELVEYFNGTTGLVLGDVEIITGQIEDKPTERTAWLSLEIIDLGFLKQEYGDKYSLKVGEVTNDIRLKPDQPSIGIYVFKKGEENIRSDLMLSHTHFSRKNPGTPFYLIGLNSEVGGCGITPSLDVQTTQELAEKRIGYCELNCPSVHKGWQEFSFFLLNYLEANKKSGFDR